MTMFDIWLADFVFIFNDGYCTSPALGVSYNKLLNQLWPQTCNCKNELIGFKGGWKLSTIFKLKSAS